MPVIVMTAAVGGPTDWQVMRKLGASRFLLEPIEPDMLHEVVQRFANGSRGG